MIRNKVLMTIKTNKAILILQISVLICSAILFTRELRSAEFIPEALLTLDNFNEHHVIVVEKSSHKLYLYENDNGIPKLVKTYPIATGKMAGNKQSQGDFRTPEGIYSIMEFIPNSELIKRYGKEGEIYGLGAFVLNYPNPADLLSNKTGGGIWLHSTNDETRIDKGLDSRGCVVISNNELKELSTYIELNKTKLIITHELAFISKDQWEAKKKYFETLTTGWLNAWINEDIDQYISYYHPTHFKDKFKGNYTNYKAYKKNVFSMAGRPKINLKNVSILNFGSYVVINFIQEYQSNTINDSGRKTLYLVRDDSYEYKIISETWGKLLSKDLNNPTFNPSMRFFPQGPIQGTNEETNQTSNEDNNIQ